MQDYSYSGLSAQEVQDSRKKNGRNIIRKYHRHGWLISFEVLTEPMLLILIAVCSIYFITGELQNGVIMLFAIVMVAAISFFQQVRSEHAVNALAKLSQSLITVIRENNSISIPSEELVAGDIIVIAEGEQIPADAIILNQNDLSVNESLLTGESFPVMKETKEALIYSGTTVVSGSAYARVVNVGNHTRVGKLGILIQEIKKEKTPLQQQVDVFVKRMALVGILAFTFVCIYNYFESKDWLHSLMHGLTLAMAVLPEEIPVALSTFMAIGAYRMLRNHVLVKQPQTVEALGSATVICVDKTGTITENKMAVASIYDHHAQRLINHGEETLSPGAIQLLKIARLASETNPFDPMEKAIHSAFEKTGIDISHYQVIKEYPLSGLHPMMTHIYKDETGNVVVSCKGAPEGILENSMLDSETYQKVIIQLKDMASRGNRVLAIATAQGDENNFPDDQKKFVWNFLGLLALNDPPKKNIDHVIQDFYNAGIEVKMITGDYPDTARSIARAIKLKNPDKIITGKEIELFTEEELMKTVSSINVFARTPPEIKLRIIDALKKNGEVVAMTGDGVNDAPALKSAHIGIAMGTTGSEVARQAASLVLVDDDLSSMVSAVSLGRKIFANLKNAIQYIISIHIPLLSIVTFPLILGWKYPNIFLPLHIIFFELMMGPTCSIAFENEPIEKSLLSQKPRKFSTDFFTGKELSISIFQGLIIAAGLMGIDYYGIHTGISEDGTRTLVFSTLVFANIFLTMTSRSKNETVLKTIRNKNYLIPLIIFITILVLIAALYWEPLRLIFNFSLISLNQLLICLMTAFASVLWIELFKISGKK